MLYECQSIRLLQLSAARRRPQPQNGLGGVSQSGCYSLALRQSRRKTYDQQQGVSQSGCYSLALPRARLVSRRNAECQSIRLLQLSAARLRMRDHQRRRVSVNQVVTA